MVPSVASRPASLAAPAMPFSRSHVTAESTSPPVSVRAFLQSIIPAPVRSRRALTSFAEMSLTGLFLGLGLLGLGLLGHLGRFDRRRLVGRRRVERAVLDEGLVGQRLAVLRGLLGALLAGVVEVALGAVGALAHDGVGLLAGLRLRLLRLGRGCGRGGRRLGRLSGRGLRRLGL